MKPRSAFLIALALSGCAPDATGNWQGSCWMELNPAVYSSPGLDLGPHEWALTMEMTEEDERLSGDFDFDSSFDGMSGNGDIEGSRSELTLTMSLDYIVGNERGRFELEVDHEEEDISGDGALYNAKDNTLQADGDCDLEYRF